MNEQTREDTETKEYIKTLENTIRETAHYLFGTSNELKKESHRLVSLVSRTTEISKGLELQAYTLLSKLK